MGLWATLIRVSSGDVLNIVFLLPQWGFLILYQCGTILSYSIKDNNMDYYVAYHDLSKTRGKKIAHLHIGKPLGNNIYNYLKIKPKALISSVFIYSAGGYKWVIDNDWLLHNLSWFDSI